MDENIHPIAAEETSSSVPTQPAVPAGEAPAPAVTYPNAAAGEAMAAPAKKGFNKVYLYLAGAVILLVALLLLLFSVFGRDQYVALKHSATVLSTDDGKAIVFDNHKPVKLTDLSGNVQIAPDNGSAVFNDEDGSLYIVKAGDKQAAKVAENAQLSCFSSDGSRYFYQTEEQEIFTAVVGKKAESIAKDATLLTVAPNGKAIVYEKEVDYYLYTGKSSKLDIKSENYTIAAISNNGKYLYSVKNEDDSLYVQKGSGDRVKLGENIEEGVVTNYDGSQVLYMADGDLYLSTGGKAGQKVLGKTLSDFQLPQNTLPYSPSGRYSVVVPVKTFVGCQVYADSGIYTLGATSEKTIKLASNIDDYWIAKNGKSLLYEKDGLLYRVENLKKEDSAKISKNQESASSLSCSEDLSKVYFVNSDDELFYVKGNSKSKKVSGGTDVERFVISCNNKTCFVVKEGELYASSNGGKLKRVSGISDFQSIVVKERHVIVVTDDAYFLSTGGTNFKKIANTGDQ